MMYRKILFLDDMQARHKSFRENSSESQSLEFGGWKVTHVNTASEAIAALGDMSLYEIVFLDHDLSEEDIMNVPGRPSKVPTGMDVVDHICKMSRPPESIVIHSCNAPAADEMSRRLTHDRQRSGGTALNVQLIPFPHLIDAMKKGRWCVE
ncbi:MAG: cyclic-phosphate processing receiver domain-containing protein [Candidatus Paceibacterota bacterium]|jgi:CheY-like chemotaxis protein